MLTALAASFQEFGYVSALSAFEFVKGHFQSPNYAVTLYLRQQTTDHKVIRSELRPENR
jgi:hypothetical protein